MPVKDTCLRPLSTTVHVRPRPLPLTSIKVHSPSSTDVHIKSTKVHGPLSTIFCCFRHGNNCFETVNYSMALCHFRRRHASPPWPSEAHSPMSDPSPIAHNASSQPGASASTAPPGPSFAAGGSLLRQMWNGALTNYLGAAIRLFKTIFLTRILLFNLG